MDETGTTGGGAGEAGTAELLRAASEQITRLVRDELRLARAEMVSKGRTAGAGAGLLGGAGIVAGYGVAALLTAAGLGLAYLLPGWLAALVVAAVLLAAAGVLARTGRRRLPGFRPPVPTQAIRDIKTDVDQMKGVGRP